MRPPAANVMGPIYRLREIQAVGDPTRLYRETAERAKRRLPRGVEPRAVEIARAVYEEIGPEPPPQPDAAGVPSNPDWWRWKHLREHQDPVRLYVKVLIWQEGENAKLAAGEDK